MHKSIIIFFMGLLVILLPFGSSMNISNANAIADYDNEIDRKQQVSVSSMKCNNINVNMNGLELDVFPPFLENSGLAAEAQEGNTDPISFAGNGDNSGSKIKDFRFVCINNNHNTVIEGGEEPTPPTTASLTVKKQVFGCDNVFGPFLTMDCSELENNSPEWLNCDDNTAISDTIFCQSLPESIFDIEVLDDQNNQIQQFEGSEQGTTIENLEPGTYTVNEIKFSEGFDQLRENPDSELACEIAGFTDGGSLFVFTQTISYPIICFEYEDEQGNDCNTITLAAGESRTCIVKNYIKIAQDVP